MQSWLASLESVGRLRTDAGLRCQVQDFENLCQLQLDTEKIPYNIIIMIKLPIEPYWTNAGRWWLENHNSNSEEFRYWLSDQGVINLFKPRSAFYAWLDFEDPKLATMFQLRWA